jgi:hypothetical protein
MALMLIHPVTQLAMNVLVVMLLLMVLVPGPNRRLRVITACALFLVAGTLFYNWRSAPRRTAPPPPPPLAELPAPPAPPSPDGVAITDLADLERLDVNVSVPDAPRVQFKDGCLVVEAPTTAAVCEPTSQRATVEGEIAEQLGGWFESLVRQAAPGSSRLRELRTTLKGLSAEQRRHVAVEVSRLRDVITQRQGEVRIYAQSQATRPTAAVAQVEPEQIIRLVKASLREARSRADGPGWPGALATIGVVLAASAVLKRVTGRYRGVRHI